MPSKAVKLPVEVVDRLEEIKEALGLRSLGEASKVLTDISLSPIGLLALAFDMRNDIKDILAELRRLNDNLEKLSELRSVLEQLVQWLPKAEE